MTETLLLFLSMLLPLLSLRSQLAHDVDSNLTLTIVLFGEIVTEHISNFCNLTRPQLI